MRVQAGDEVREEEDADEEAREAEVGGVHVGTILELLDRIPQLEESEELEQPHEAQHAQRLHRLEDPALGSTHELNGAGVSIGGDVDKALDRHGRERVEDEPAAQVPPRDRERAHHQ